VPTLVQADLRFRRVLAWRQRIHVFYLCVPADNRIVVIHVRGARQKPLNLRALAR
jgi:hypothetical protein